MQALDALKRLRVSAPKLHRPPARKFSAKLQRCPNARDTDDERHEITIAVDGTGRVNAYVDGQLVEANLFANLRVRIFAIVAVFMIVICVLALFVATLLFKA